MHRFVVFTISRLLSTHASFQAIEIQNDNILYDLTNNFRFDGHGKNVLSQMLNEIREEYKVKDHDMRDELHRKCTKDSMFYCFFFF